MPALAIILCQLLLWPNPDPGPGSSIFSTATVLRAAECVISAVFTARSASGSYAGGGSQSSPHPSGVMPTEEASQRSFEAIAAMEAAAKLLQSDPGRGFNIATEFGRGAVERLASSALPALMHVLRSGGTLPAGTTVWPERQQQQQLEACCVVPPHLSPVLAPACYRVLTGLVSLLLHERQVARMTELFPGQRQVLDAWVEATCLIADWVPTHRRAAPEGLLCAASKAGAVVPELQDQPPCLALNLRLAALNVSGGHGGGREQRHSCWTYGQPAGLLTGFVRTLALGLR